jgi:hypothetical protein
MAAIYESDVIPFLLKRCPATTPSWAQHVADGDTGIGLYIDFIPFIQFAIRALVDGDAESLEQLFGAIEELTVRGDDLVQNAAVVGFMEGLQNSAGGTHVDPDRFRPFLGPASTIEWDALNKAWGGTGYVPSTPIEKLEAHRIFPSALDDSLDGGGDARS